MNYQRIYDQFIADRLLKEPDSFRGVNYFSRRYCDGADKLQHHHILPKSLGGTNDSGNIVSLTPREHIHAHLLLAEIHGGTMWAAVKLMCETSSSSRIPTKKQKALASIAAINHSKSISGKKNPFHGKKHSKETIKKLIDPTIYTLKNKDGQSISGTKHSLGEALGSARAANAVINGSKKTAYGWYNAELHDKYPTARDYWRSKSEQITIYHIDGEVYSGLAIDAPIKYTLLKTNKKNMHVNNWFRSEIDRDNYEEWNKKRLTKISHARFSQSNERDRSQAAAPC